MQYNLIRKNDTGSQFVEILICVVISILVLIDIELWYLVPLFFLLVSQILRPIRWVGICLGLIIEFSGLFVLFAGLSEWNERIQVGYGLGKSIDLLIGTVVLFVSLISAGCYLTRKYFLLKPERKNDSKGSHNY